MPIRSRMTLKKNKKQNKNIVYDKYSEKFGPLYVGPKSLHDRQYNALRHLGPYCPKCKELATAFEVIHNPLRDMYEGMIRCTSKKCKRKTYAMLFHEDTNKWEFEYEVRLTSEWRI